MSLRPSTLFGAILAGSAALFVGAAGCEFIASVDRSKIPEPDAGTTTTTTGTGGGGTGGTNTGGTTTGGGGAGGGECQTADQCPGTDTDCVKRTCEAGVCGTMNEPDGATVTAQTAGDCIKVVCDGLGGVKNTNDDLDVPDDGTDCTVDGCDNGAPTSMDAPINTACTDNGGTVCDGAGVCVECNNNPDCNGTDICQNHQCVPATCNDNIKDGTETDIDCGGACSGCATNQDCLVGADCLDKICSGNPLKCAAPLCNDSVQNGTESDVDCGGTCPGCAFMENCNGNADCLGGQCTAGTCAATCTDTVKNGTEGDVDCGGTCANKCTTGDTCNVAADCDSGVCNVTCQAPACNDGVKNGTETDVDCGGGGACPACADDKACLVAGDCASHICVGLVCGLNGCDPTTAVDITATPTIEFGDAVGNVYKHASSAAVGCFKVTAGTGVTFQPNGVATFAQHPLQPGRVVGANPTPDNTGPIVFTNSGTVTVPTPFVLTPGNYGFYCTVHFGSGMKGAIFVQ